MQKNYIELSKNDYIRELKYENESLKKKIREMDKEIQEMEKYISGQD